MRVSPVDVDLIYVDSDEKAQAFREWTPVSHFVAIDVETTGLQPFGPRADKIRLVQVGDENTGWAIPYSPATEDLVASALFRFPGRITGHNSPFDRAFLDEAGHQLVGPPWFDTFLAHHLLYPLDFHGLKPAASQFYGWEVRAGEKWLQKVMQQTGTDWATVPIDHPAYWGYAAFDTVLSARLATDMKPKLDTEMPQQYRLERRISYMMRRMAKRGLPLDMEYAAQLLDRWAVEEREIRAKLEKWLIENPNSGAQVVAALENDGWEPDVFTDGGKPSVNRAVLEGMQHEVATLVLRYRRLRKWSQTYVLPAVESSGRFYPLVNSMKAKTGRMSIEGGIDSAPLQQFPSGAEVRRMVLAEEGRDLWSCDYTGQEMRLICAFAQDPGLTRAVLNGEDVHGRIAAELFGDFTPQQRKWCKNGLYAWAYGAQDKRLALTVHAPASKFKDAVGRAYPGIPNLMRNVVAKAKERQERDGMSWARTLGNRIVAVPKSRQYALTDYIMQGSGSDMMKQALDRIEDAGLGDTISLVIHDENLASLPQGPEGEEAAHEIANLMTTEFRGVPFDTDAAGPARSWGDESVIH